MELGHQIQVLGSVVAIVGAGCVAFICDLLKRKNEQLRELAIELNVRCEEEQKRFQLFAPRALAQLASSVERIEAPAAPPAAPVLVSKPVSKPAAEPAAAPSQPRTNRKDRADKSRSNSEALAAMQRGAQLASAPGSRRPERLSLQSTGPSPAAAHRPKPAVEPEPVAAPDPVIVPAAPPTPEPVAEVHVIQPSAIFVPPAPAKRDWATLLSTRKSAAAPPRRASKVSRTAGAEPSATSDSGSVLPAGFQDGFVLRQLVDSRRPVSGLVVSIGASSPNPDAAVPPNVVELIHSLIGAGDFAAQSGKDEFLLIYPNERGAAAQRKLSQIAERLWEFQLRALGTLSIQFSWGGVEVRSESIAEAVSSATERMQETRRNRKVLTMEPRPEPGTLLRRAV